MTVNVFTSYDDSEKVIARIKPNENHEISERTYKNLLSKRTVGGTAGIYTDAGFDINVVGKYGFVTVIRSI